jgi:3-oxoacyl-[acyl-carrier-protein] synthase I
VLRHAADADWLLRPGNSQGYIPGEAAACVLLDRIANVTDIATDDFALHRPALAHASARLWPRADRADATPLCKALSAALASSGMDPTNISHLESEMDGSDWRGQIESTALNRVIFTETTALPQWRPATLFGQVGAAGGIIAWLLPAMLHRQRIDRVNTVLNWSIEPSGDIAACVLERSPH